MKKLFLLPILFFVLGCQENNNNDDLIYQNPDQAGLAQIAETVSLVDLNNETDTDGIADNLDDSLIVGIVGAT